jgi:predicted nucleotidyltransferase
VEKPITADTQLAAGVQPPGFAPVTVKALDEIVRRVVTNLHPEKIILFGPYGYGKPTNDSDVDLLVIMETSGRPADRYLAVSRLLRPRPFPLDILVKTPTEIAQALEKKDFFIREIVTRGQVLYERPDGIFLPVDQDTLQRLTAYAVQVRYPGEAPTEDEAHLSLKTAQAVRRFARKLLEVG